MNPTFTRLGELMSHPHAPRCPAIYNALAEAQEDSYITYMALDGLQRFSHCWNCQSTHLAPPQLQPIEHMYKGHTFILQGRVQVCLHCHVFLMTKESYLDILKKAEEAYADMVAKPEVCYTKHTPRYNLQRLDFA